MARSKPTVDARRETMNSSAATASETAHRPERGGCVAGRRRADAGASRGGSPQDAWPGRARRMRPAVMKTHDNTGLQTSSSALEGRGEEMSPLLTQDPLHSIRPTHDDTSITTAFFALTRWPPPRVDIFESADEAGCVTTPVAAPPWSCFRGTPATHSQSWCVRRRPNRWCHCEVICCLLAGPDGWRR
jgi:hypothetical protein